MPPGGRRKASNNYIKLNNTKDKKKQPFSKSEKGSILER
jgi:hypothetical protein